MGSRRTETERRTPTPAKIAFAGQNVCGIDVLEERSPTGRHHGTCKADSFAKYGRGDPEHIHRRNQPLCESDIGILGLRKLSKGGTDRIGRSTGFKPGIQWMGSEVLLGALLVSIEGRVEDVIEVVGKGSGGWDIINALLLEEGGDGREPCAMTGVR